MKTVKDYPITLPYGSTEPPYGTPAFPYHRGRDYGCPDNTPLTIGGQLVAYSGHTGLVTAPHLHCQEWRGTVYDTREPQHAFESGIVQNIGVGTQFGNYITISNPDGWNTSYCHLTKVNSDIIVGQKVGGTVVNEENAAKIVQRSFFYITGVDPTTAEEKEWTAKVLQDPNIIDELEDFLNDSPKGQQFQYKARHYDEDIKAAQGDAIKLEHGKKYLAP